MEKVVSQINEWKSSLPSDFEQIQSYAIHIKDSIPTSIEELQPGIDYVKSITTEDIIRDFSEFKISPITVSLTITAFTTLIILTKVFTGNYPQDKSSKKANKKSKSKKKPSKAQKANKNIQEILDFVESEYVPQIDEYLHNHKDLTREELEFKYNYFEEMLLKELVKLDSIDVTGNAILRENRKKVIQFIQDHHNRLDKFKKEAKF
ncbi:BAG domain-containing protein [Scheffersomyces amazonensis]|uniref:BAG domain-containing protein n=1 Tax=Scheffersomyces amazonensis TaxID=1078765 RepID=UPI00315D4BD7